MNIELSSKEFRHLLDMVYIGNWVLNSLRGNDRFEEYDHVASKIFANCAKLKKFHSLFEIAPNQILPSQAFMEGGIHDAICEYEDTIFYEILAEELARKDMESESINNDNIAELLERIEDYITEFEQNGMDNISLDN